MKKGNLIWLMLLPLAFMACKKDEGPVIDKGQIVRKWQMDKYYGKGADSTQYFNIYHGNYEIDIQANGNYVERYTFFGSPKVLNGSWSFINTNSTYLHLQDSAEERVLLVLSLESTDMKLKNPNADQQFWLKPKQ